MSDHLPPKTSDMPTGPEEILQRVREITLDITKMLGLNIDPRTRSETIYNNTTVRENFFANIPVNSIDQIPYLLADLRAKFDGNMTGVEIELITQIEKRVMILLLFKDYLEKNPTLNFLSFYNLQAGKPDSRRILGALTIHSYEVEQKLAIDENDIADIFDYKISYDNFNEMIEGLLNGNLSVPISLFCRLMPSEDAARKTYNNAVALERAGLNPVSAINYDPAFESGMYVSIFIPELALLSRKRRIRDNLFKIPEGEPKEIEIRGRRFPETMFAHVIEMLMDMHVRSGMAHGYLFDSLAMYFSGIEEATPENTILQLNNPYRVASLNLSMLSVEGNSSYVFDLINDINDLLRIIQLLKTQKKLTPEERKTADELLNLYCTSVEGRLVYRQVFDKEAERYIKMTRSAANPHGINVQVTLGLLRNEFKTEG